MAILVSPGVSVSITDQSFFIPNTAPTVPLIFLATADQKTQPDGVTPAAGTYENNVVRAVTSLSQSSSLYGIPKFLTDSQGNALHGDTRNEYGVFALNQFLGVANLAYTVRADVNLNDNQADIINMWDKAIQAAGVTLEQLTATRIQEYNTANQLVPTSVGVVSALSATTPGTGYASSHYSNVPLVGGTGVGAVANITTAGGGVTQIALVTGGTGYTTGDVLTAPSIPTGTGFTTTVANVLNYKTAVTSSEYLSDAAAALAPVYKMYSFRNLESKFQNDQSNFTCSSAGGFTGSGLCVYTNGYSLPATDGYVGLNTFVQNWIYSGNLIDLTNGGAGFVDGYYPNVPLTTLTGTGHGAVADLTVINGTVISVEFTSADYGTGYTTGDTLSVSTVNVPLRPGFTTNTFVVTYTTNTNNMVIQPSEVATILQSAGDMFKFTAEFLNATALGSNDAARRVAIVQALAAAINNPNADFLSDVYEYNLILCPGYHEVVDEMISLSLAIHEEAFVIGDTPMNMSPEDVVSLWADSTTSTRQHSNDTSYYYPHCLGTNLDGAKVYCAMSGTALKTYAYSDSVSEVWFAPAGITRGVVTGIEQVGYVTGTLGTATTFVPTNLNQGQRDNLYKNFTNINPVPNLPGRGIIIFGQKTSQSAASALDRVNVARLMKYIRRQLRKSTVPFLFEPNDSITRGNVKAMVDGFLHKIMVKRGLYDFATICDTSNNTPDVIDNNELYIDIAVQPEKSIEFIYIPIVIRPSGASLFTNVS